MTSVFEPARLGPLTLRNRVVKAATFEGRTRRGVVGPELVEFHREVAAGGVGLTTVAYCAVSPAGRVFRNCLVLDRDTVPSLRVLTDAVHAEGAAASAQLGHAGLVADQVSNGVRSLAPSTRLSPVAKGLVRGASAADLASVRASFVSAALAAVDAGFDCLEVHLGHNYLLSSFLSPNLNRRRDSYGGSVEARSRFPREVLSAVRDAVGDRAAVVAKLNMRDGVPQGLQVPESLEVARLLEADGSVDALQLTGGSSLLNGMLFFRGDVPIEEFAATQPAVLRPLVKPFLRRIMPSYPFEEAFFLDEARVFLQALSLPLVLLGGVNRVDTMQAAVDEGFSFVALARALLRDPDLVSRMASGAVTEGRCTHCNLCAPTIYSREGTHCVLR
ncbi:MAG: NADH:flavin oxidoreductase [Mycobacteriales bacterium]|nr:NADH:flavin oxidoreductase [Mycobacteriales bacterium]